MDAGLSSEAIPMTILTGYLGAGKTTLLNRILNADHGMRVAVLVNDFGSVNIDAKLIVGVEGEKITLSNGCICCTIRGDLVEAIERLIDDPQPPDFILIEASGVSDPAQVVLTFNRSRLRAHVRIDSIVAVVDAEHFREITGKPERLLYGQVRVADMVILNKVDLVAPEVVAAAHEWITSTVHKARIIEAVECDVPLEAVIGSATYNPQIAFDTSGPGIHVHDVDETYSHSHNDHSLVFTTWSWQSDEALVISEIRRVLEELPSIIFRVKGVLYVREVPDRKIVLQMVGKRASLTEGDPWADEDQRQSTIVFIGEMGSINKQELEAKLETTRSSQVPENEIMQLVDGVLKWLRIKQ